jgi:hypothetical protein|tara:strand:- start:371 stop:1324 length:954 start_codon:yes stop_codon:yes gene_type:complete
MANPTSRSTLQDYCKRALGDGVIDINISTNQLEDRTDEALQFFQEYHFDGVEKTLLKHKITATTITLSAAVSGNFNAGEKITGGTSGATATIIDAPTTTTIRIKNHIGTFQASETITGAVTSSTATISSISLGDISNGYIPITSDLITGVVKIFPFTNRSDLNMFDVNYQLRLNEVFDFTSTSVIYYTMVQRHISLLNEVLVGKKPFRFSRHQDQLHIDMDWDNDVDVDSFLVVEAYRILDPQTYTDVYNDMFLKRYLIALLKLQWGNNLIKFQGVQMPGGVTLNGEQIYNEAKEEKRQIEEEVSLKYELPVDFITG